jgi:hypothetical protein
LREYFENQYPNKLENLEEMDTFLDAFSPANIEPRRYNPLKWIYNNEFEIVIKNLPTKKSPGLMDSLLNSTTYLKRN